jgi:hypothetical protein
MNRARISRRTLLGGAAVAGLAAVVPVSGLAAPGLSRRDRRIFEFALVLEELQAAFYTEAERIGALHGELAELARIVGGHERAHVQAIRAVLGHRQPASPRFDFNGATETPSAFVRTSVAFEDLGVAAYKGQFPRIESKPLLATALSIHAVEARHAAWIRRVAGILPAPQAFDKAQSEQAIDKIVRSTRFVVASSAASAPEFTG